MTTTLADLVRQAAGRLRQGYGGPGSHPDQNPALDAEVLARYVLGWDRARWLADARTPPPPDFETEFEALVQRRLKSEPVAYLTRAREFWGLEFEVSPDVLIPRPETELLVEEALRLIDARHVERVADVGTGSGCIAVAIASARPGVQVIATDISAKALQVARRNAARHDVSDRVTFLETPVLGGVGEVDLVVSNPPYISRDALPSLMRDVVDFEPHTALFASGDGLDVVRALLADVSARAPMPPLLFEFGGQESAVREAVRAAGLRLSRIIPDLAGIPRIAVVEA